MGKNNILVIIESPGKILTVSNIFKKLFPHDNVLVVATKGHILDITKSGGGKKDITNFCGVNVQDVNKTIYEPISGRGNKSTKNTISFITNKVKYSDTIYVATDGDREGEMIAWSVLRCIPASIQRTKNIIRIRFNEITESAISQSLRGNGKIDETMLWAQKTRRIIDRIIGYGLSFLPGGTYQFGRVQLSALNLLSKINYDHLIRSELYFSNTLINGKFALNHNNRQYIIDCVCNGPLVDHKIIKRNTYHISDHITEDVVKICPPKPYRTTTYQRDAIKNYKIVPQVSMKFAQDLYEKGLITYMRTSSTSISTSFTPVISNYIKDKFGDKFVKIRDTTNNSAHEAIRVTRIGENISKYNLKPLEEKLYWMIFRNTIMSQMTDCIVDRYNVNILKDESDETGEYNDDDVDYYFTGHIDKIVHLGFKALIKKYSREYAEDITNITNNAELNINEIKDISKNLKSVRIVELNYSISSGIKPLSIDQFLMLMEDNYIGQPSTYSKTINEIIHKKRYVVVAKHTNKIQDINWKLQNNEWILNESTRKNIVDRLELTQYGEYLLQFSERHFFDVIDINFCITFENLLLNIKNNDTKAIQDVYNSVRFIIDRLSDIRRK